MQKSKTQSKPQNSIEHFPTIDDFFTQFLDKKKRNYTKKLEKIESLQKKNIEELTAEQKESLTNKQKLVEKAQHYDQIKQLYFEASSKKEGVRPDKCTETTNCIKNTLGLYYLGNCAKENGQIAMKVLAAHGVDFQEKVHQYHNKIFHADYRNLEEIKKAEDSLAEYLKDGDVAHIAGNIVAEGKLAVKHEIETKDHNQKESVNKPNLFAMSSDEEEEEEHQIKEDKKSDAKISKEHEIKPTFVPLPEDDGEEGFIFETGNRRGGKPRGDRPYKKYDGEQREHRVKREYAEGEKPQGDRPYKKYDGEHRVKREYTEGEKPQGNNDETGEKQHSRGRGYRHGNPDKTHEQNRENGDRRKPFGRGRDKNFNKERRDDQDYQKKEAHAE